MSDMSGMSGMSGMSDMLRYVFNTLTNQREKAFKRPERTGTRPIICNARTKAGTIELTQELSN